MYTVLRTFKMSEHTYLWMLQERALLAFYWARTKDTEYLAMYRTFPHNEELSSPKMFLASLLRNPLEPSVYPVNSHAPGYELHIQRQDILSSNI